MSFAWALLSYCGRGPLDKELPGPGLHLPNNWQHDA
jgi:hypothetical protein